MSLFFVLCYKELVWGEKKEVYIYIYNILYNTHYIDPTHTHSIAIYPTRVDFGARDRVVHCELVPSRSQGT